MEQVWSAALLEPSGQPCFEALDSADSKHHCSESVQRSAGDSCACQDESIAESWPLHPAALLGDHPCTDRRGQGGHTHLEEVSQQQAKAQAARDHSTENDQVDQQLCGDADGERQRRLNIL